MTIAPRWEWRTFGDDFGAAEDRFAGLEPERSEDGDETYLLSTEGDASVKIRAGLMDVKTLQAVDADGLEQWLPVMKASDPLPARDVQALFEALAVTPPTLERDGYTFDQLMKELIEPAPELRAARVHKHRDHFTVGGCMAELSQVTTGGRSRRTLAVESTDPTAVIAAVRDLGLAKRRNVSMSQGLKALLGVGSRRFAVLDVGTNSVKFHVAERAADGGWTTLVDRAEVTRLGEGLGESGRFGDEAMARTMDAIAAMVDEARRQRVEAIAAVGTAGLRIAGNRDDLIAAVRERTGVGIEVIPGEEEARLAYLAAVSGLGLGGGSRVVFDTGGGSSQFTFGDGDHIETQFSVNVGAARFTERYRLDGPVGTETIAAAREAIGADLARLDGRPPAAVVVGLGGGITNMAAVRHGLTTYDPDVVQGTVLDVAEVDRQIELYRTRDADGRRQIDGLQPKRAEVILAGACIVREVLARLHAESLTVSDRGLRHGLLVERFG